MIRSDITASIKSIVSVGHRKRLVEFHDRKITLKKGDFIEFDK